MEDLVTTLGTLYLTRQAGLESATAVNMAISAVSDYSSGYDRTVAEWMDKPQNEIEQNRVYRELRRQGITDFQARFIIGQRSGKGLKSAAGGLSRRSREKKARLAGFAPAADYLASIVWQPI